MSEPRFVVVGDLMTDVVAQARGPVRRGSDTDARITTHPGGAGANTAAWLASEGAPVALVGRVGDDAIGRTWVAGLVDAGVQVHAPVDPVRSTGTVVVVVDPDGERSMLPDAGANAGLSPADLPEALFAKGRHLHLSGYTLLHDGCRAAGLVSFDLARRRGMTISVDPASAGPIGDLGVERFLGWIEGADVLLANEDEVLRLTGEGDPEAAARALAGSFSTVVVKLGAHGALLVSGDRPAVQAQAVAVSVVDTTGAGDAFAAGFLPAWADGATAMEALAAGNRVASYAVSRVGARP